MMNNNCQEYDFSVEFLLLRCNKPFPLFKEYTHKAGVKLMNIVGPT